MTQGENLLRTVFPKKGLFLCMAHVEQLAHSSCRTDIKGLEKHNLLVLGQLVIIGPGTPIAPQKSGISSLHSDHLTQNPGSLLLMWMAHRSHFEKPCCRP